MRSTGQRAASFFAMRDFLFAALLAWMTPLVAATRKLRRRPSTQAPPTSSGRGAIRQRAASDIIKRYIVAGQRYKIWPAVRADRIERTVYRHLVWPPRNLFGIIWR